MSNYPSTKEEYVAEIEYWTEALTESTRRQRKYADLGDEHKVAGIEKWIDNIISVIETYVTEYRRLG